MGFYVSDYKQRCVIPDHIRSLLAGPDRSGLVVPAVQGLCRKRPNLRLSHIDI